MSATNIHTSYAHVQDGGACNLLPVDGSFWPRLMQGEYPELEQGRLLSISSFEESWTSWECHPAGDELVLLMTGQAELILQTEAGEQSVNLMRMGDFVLVPKNTWHTARIHSPAQLLFLTPGAGTMHKPL